jgi:hypothetical protein
MNLSEALRSANQALTWKEWEQALPQTPEYARSFGSPTILINGCDIAGVGPNPGSSCCRIYESPEKATSGVPPVALITSALADASRHEQQKSSKRAAVFTLPGILVSVLPFGACPACWPVYGSVLSALGLGFLISSRYLFPLTAVFLLIALFTLAYRARLRRGYGPFAVGSFAGALILYGKFSLQQSALAYLGAALLVASSLWNAWPRRIAPAHRCELTVAKSERC